MDTSDANPPSIASEITAVKSAWPPRAQLSAATLLTLAIAYILGSVTTLAGIQGLGYLGLGNRPTQLERSAALTRVDLNRAGRAELLQVPGVGETLADHILTYREQRGPFQSVEQLQDVPGIGAANLERMRPFVTVATGNTTPFAWNDAAPAAPATSGSRPKKADMLKGPIDVNRASLAELQTLPRIGPTLSQRIVDEREKRPFKNVEDLRRVSGIGPKTVESLRPHVTFGSEATASAPLE